MVHGQGEVTGGKRLQAFAKNWTDKENQQKLTHRPILQDNLNSDC